MTDTITIRGHIGTDVESETLESGVAVSRFRVASTERRPQENGSWQDVHTNWYTVSCFRQLALNAKASLTKGDRVIIHGRLRLNNWRKKDGSTGYSFEVLADSIGPDLTWGTVKFARNVFRSAQSSESADSESSADQSNAEGGTSSDPDGGDSAVSDDYSADTQGDQSEIRTDAGEKVDRESGEVSDTEESGNFSPLHFGQSRPTFASDNDDVPDDTEDETGEEGYPRSA